MPPGRRVSGTTVVPWCAVRGRRCTRGSPVGGASTSSSSGTWCARASGSSSSRVGLRSPDSSRDSVLTEMPVAAESWASVSPRCCRRVRSRGPMPVSTSSKSTTPVCRSGKEVCQDGGRGSTLPGMRENEYDVVVVGGGAAGLSGALTLARAGRSVLVVDDGTPRNAPAGHVHNYLGREGTPPAELYAIGRAEVAGYGGEVIEGRVSGARRDGEGFLVTLDDGEGRARRLLVTTGLVDELPEVPGVAQQWGRGVLHCPFCHGAEVRDRPIGILGTNPFAVHQALMWRQWSADVVLFRHTSPEPSDEEREQLAARGIVVVEGAVAGLVADGDRLTGVRLGDGTVVEREAVVVSPRFTARAELLAPLGLTAEERLRDGVPFASAVPAGPTGATAVPGVWVAGNVADPTAQVVVAAGMGLMAGAHINGDLVEEDTRRAVEAHR